MDVVFLHDMLVRVRGLLRLPYLVTSVIAHMVVCTRFACFGVNDSFCMIVITVACLGLSASWPLDFFVVGAGTTSTSIFSTNPSALAGFVIGVFLLCKTHIWRAAIILLCVFEETRDSSKDVLVIRVGCSLGPLVAFLLCGFVSVSSWLHSLHVLSFGV